MNGDWFQVKSWLGLLFEGGLVSATEIELETEEESTLFRSSLRLPGRTVICLAKYAAIEEWYIYFQKTINWSAPWTTEPIRPVVYPVGVDGSSLFHFPAFTS